jgi:hypothetical protein
MNVLMLINMIVFTDTNNTRDWCVDCCIQTVGYCVVDKVLIMLDGDKKDVRKQLTSMEVDDWKTAQM